MSFTAHRHLMSIRANHYCFFDIFVYRCRKTPDIPRYYKGIRLAYMCRTTDLSQASWYPSHLKITARRGFEPSVARRVIVTTRLMTYCHSSPSIWVLFVLPRQREGKCQRSLAGHHSIIRQFLFSIWPYSGLSRGDKCILFILLISCHLSTHLSYSFCSFDYSFE